MNRKLLEDFANENCLNFKMKEEKAPLVFTTVYVVGDLEGTFVKVKYARGSSTSVINKHLRLEAKVLKETTEKFKFIYKGTLFNQIKSLFKNPIKIYSESEGGIFNLVRNFSNNMGLGELKNIDIRVEGESILISMESYYDVNLECYLSLIQSIKDYEKK